jgi:Holliday junction resolvase RusA-like endonuclease
MTPARTLKIVLPWPAKELSPNARCHWAAKHRQTSKTRGDAKIAAIKAIRDAGWKTCELAKIEPVFYSPISRRRDGDNAVASCKSIFDGLADAGVIQNDCGFAVMAPRFEKHADKRLELIVTKVA